MPVNPASLTALPGFADLTDGQKHALAQVLTDRRCAAGELIFEQGQPGMTCAIIISGTVYAELNAGRDRPSRRLSSMFAGELFGEIALLDGGLRTSSCVAGAEGAHIALLSRDDFSLLFEAGNPFAFAIVRLVSRQLARRARHAARMWSEMARERATGKG